MESEQLSKLLMSANCATVVTEPYAPYRIIAVNHVWEDLCGYSEKEAKGRTFRFLQGADTDAAELERLSTTVERGLPYEGVITNYKKSGSTFRNHLRIAPIFNCDGSVAHYVGVIFSIDQRLE